MSGQYRLDRTRALWTRASAVIPGGTCTFSKRVEAFADIDSFPSHVVAASGARVTDADGNVYLDYIAALAPIVLGYNEPRVQARIADQLGKVVLASLPPPEEIELAELITECIPSAEMVRFFKSGAEAVSAGVRTARTYTGRDFVLSCGYHGWHDWYAAVRQSDGIPVAVSNLTRSFAFNDIAAARALVDELGRSIACIVVTPALYGKHPAPGFLEGLRALADRIGAVLIFDEIITGFRWAVDGAQGYYGVAPDLSAFGKAMANGMPIAALAGQRDIMLALDRTWVTSTYASEALSIVAGLETIAILREGTVIPRLHAMAQQFVTGLAAVSKATKLAVTISQPLPALCFAIEPVSSNKSRFDSHFIRACARRGILIRRDETGFSLCLMAALTDDDIAHTLAVFEEAARIADTPEGET